ncbi:TlpA family protein disulfide reductase [bacterium]|nr:TlpA family protein disulfide reductase [bacterium]
MSIEYGTGGEADEPRPDNGSESPVDDAPVAESPVEDAAGETVAEDGETVAEDGEIVAEDGEIVAASETDADTAKTSGSERHDEMTRPSDLIGATPATASSGRARVAIGVIIALALGIGVGVLVGLAIGGDDAVAASTTSAAVTTQGPGATTVTTPPATTETTQTGPDTTAPGSDLLTFGTVEVEGETLPRLPDDGSDLFVGMAVPTLRSLDLNGEPIEIDMADGQAKMVMFVAHWCPHCQDELPVVHDWLLATEFPDNVDFYTVSTLTQADRTNFPPGPWFVAEDWQWPVFVDDERSTASTAVGLPAVPFWLLVNTDGTLAARGPAALPAEALDNVLEQLTQGPNPPEDGS